MITVSSITWVISMHVPSPVAPDACIAAAPHLHETLAIELPQPLGGLSHSRRGKNLACFPLSRSPGSMVSFTAAYFH